MYKNLVLILLVGLLLFGCPSTKDGTSPAKEVDEETFPNEEHTEPPQTESTEQDESTETTEPEPSKEDSTEPDTPDTTVTPGDENSILLLGRSVTFYWTEYMGLEWICDDEECATGSPRGEYEGHDFIYYELDYPPEIANSAAAGVDLYGSEAEFVFFKLCFVDFEPDESGELLARNKRMVEDAYTEIVTTRGKTMVVGNALPMVAQHTEPMLVSDHLAYNSWLNDFASTHDDIYVLDLYGILADSNGALKPEYAVSSEDSHLTNAAYDEITPEFFAIIGEA
ncbi:MAG: hypothetical protein GY852_00425 [bacterium]|nr:hypothetical protein [bacterium]